MSGIEDDDAHGLNRWSFLCGRPVWGGINCTVRYREIVLGDLTIEEQGDPWMVTPRFPRAARMVVVLLDAAHVAHAVVLERDLGPVGLRMVGGEDQPSLADEGWGQLDVGEPSKGTKPEGCGLPERLRPNEGVALQAVGGLERSGRVGGVRTETAVQRSGREPLGREELLPTETVGAAVALSEGSGHRARVLHCSAPDATHCLG